MSGYSVISPEQKDQSLFLGGSRRPALFNHNGVVTHEADGGRNVRLVLNA